MMSRRYDAADALMLTGTLLQCPDCGDERIFITPDTGESTPDWVDYVCTDCGGAVSLLASMVPADPPASHSDSRVSRAARTA
ncbi:MAG: hypothetical protein GEU93_14175 [Propionibacteriales bacterium]|nr:hypothetical protein [Propionibacteriales bacterium]